MKSEAQAGIYALHQKHNALELELRGTSNELDSELKSLIQFLFHVSASCLDSKNKNACHCMDKKVLVRGPGLGEIVGGLD